MDVDQTRSCDSSHIKAFKQNTSEMFGNEFDFSAILLPNNWLRLFEGIVVCDGHTACAA